jgi:Asp-tRNA(Asn)/Glu-tRNA(Gln) amidotransferase A subunit family amidase
MVPLALGTQTVGSIIRPAAYCGVVGFKPSFGRIPIDGVIPNAASLDTVGIFAADVASVARTAPVLCDGWTAFVGNSRPVLGIPDGPYLGRADAVALDAFQEQVGALEAAGFTVRRIPVMADFEDIAGVLFIVNRYELAQSHAEWFRQFHSLYREQTAVAIRQGLAIDRADYEKAVRGRAEFRARLLDDMTVDLWITPAATGPAPAGLHSTGDSVLCLPWSYAGMPALALPAGQVGGLPLGLQVVGRPGADERLVAWASDIETALSTTRSG